MVGTRVEFSFFLVGGWATTLHPSPSSPLYLSSQPSLALFLGGPVRKPATDFEMLSFMRQVPVVMGTKVEFSFFGGVPQKLHPFPSSPLYLSIPCFWGEGVPQEIQPRIPALERPYPLLCQASEVGGNQG